MTKIQTKPIYDPSEMIEFTSISVSPFYRRGETAMPTGQQVEPGGLYMDDNSGGVVSQISIPTNLDAQLPTGTVDLEQRSATIHAGYIADAVSFKGQEGDDPIASNWVQVGKRGDTFRIINLIEKDYEPLGNINPERFTVNAGTDEAFNLYSVHNENNQLYIVHSVEPEAIDGGTKTKTAMHGLIYVEYKQKVYLGMLEELPMVIEDPSGAFRE